MSEPDPNGRDRPDLPVLPPVMPLTALALAAVLEWAAPLGWLPRPLAPVPTILGLLIVAAALGLGIWGAMTFRRAATNVDPRRPALRLVETGPYRFTRNPMYVGFLLLFLGVGLIASLDWSLPLLPALWLALHHGVVLREEAYLSRKFGDAYDDFRARTRRWL